MRNVMTILSGLLLGSVFVGCATTPTDDNEPGDTLADGAADSWGSPTRFGALFQGVWQFGHVDPSSSIRFPTWDFSVDGAASVTITTREAPTDEPELTATALYLYQQRDDGTYRRIARALPADGEGFATLTRALDEGTYRVLAKGLSGDAYGGFMLRMDCTGDGCEAGPQCLFGSGEFHEIRDVHEGSLLSYGDTRLTVTSQMTDALKQQIIAAVRESSHDDVTTIEQAFDAVDLGEINRYWMWDDLRGESIYAIEYGAGDNSYGAFFHDNAPTPIAAIHDGYLDECTWAPRACVFGQYKNEAQFMPEMKRTGLRELAPTDPIDPRLESQIRAALSYGEPGETVAELIEMTDDGTVTIEQLEHADGRKFIGIHWYGGDNPVGAFFPADSDAPAAQISDGEIGNCNALY